MVASEFELIRRFFRRPVAHALLGVGDDAALVRADPDADLALATDLLLEGRHFRRTDDPRALGHKALAVNLSDMAAIGATPRWALLALALPEPDEAWLAAFADGLYALAARFGVEIVGGDTTRGPLTLCVAIAGEVPRGGALLRSGAAPGDDIWVSGELGAAALALERPEDVGAARRLAWPEPRVALGERLRGVASAAIDVSDGFAQDLVHVLESSGVRATVHEPALPGYAGLAAPGIATELARRCLLAGGDDYELVFTAPPARRGEVEAIGRELGLALARVGTIERGAPALTVLDAEGRPVPLPRGYDHFGNSPP